MMFITMSSRQAEVDIVGVVVGLVTVQLIFPITTVFDTVTNLKKYVIAVKSLPFC